MAKHNASITQESERPSRDGAGRPSSPYKSGANVHKGSGGKEGASGVAPAAQPQGKPWSK